jgi:hypothetical protein
MVGRQQRRVRAREATGEERDRLWRRWIEVEPPLEELADRRATETPVIVFEPLDEAR